jgi:hypothetical protein
MKKTLLAALVVLMAAPAFSNEVQQQLQTKVGPEEIQKNVDQTPIHEVQTDESFFEDPELIDEDPALIDEEEEGAFSTNAHRNRYHRRFLCLTGDIFGRTYIGRDFIRGRAIRESLMRCRRTSFFAQCRFRYCVRRGVWYDDRHGGGPLN